MRDPISTMVSFPWESLAGAGICIFFFLFTISSREPAYTVEISVD